MSTGIVFDKSFGSYNCLWDENHVENPLRLTLLDIYYALFTEIFVLKVRVCYQKMLRIGFIGEVQKNSCKVGFPYNY